MSEPSDQTPVTSDEPCCFFLAAPSHRVILTVSGVMLSQVQARALLAAYRSFLVDNETASPDRPPWIPDPVLRTRELSSAMAEMGWDPR